MNYLEIAQQYVSLGWNVLPVRGDKTPRLTTWKYLQRKRATETEIVNWFQNNGGIGIITGAISGITVVDCDDQAAIDRVENLLPVGLETPIANTPRGRHYYFKYNNESNSTGRLPKVDVRGEGGYVVAPDGVTPERRWIIPPESCATAPMPPQLVTALESPSDTGPGISNIGAYGQAALADELARLAMAGKGTRNETLNRCAFRLGQLVGGRQLNERTVRDALSATAMGVGLPQGEVERTITSGLDKGKKEPRYPQESVKSVEPVKSVTIGQHRTSTSQSSDKNRSNRHEIGQFEGARFEGNLTGEIKKWVSESTGCFTTLDVDREFGLTLRQDKKRRADALRKLIKENMIKKDRRTAGKYHIMASHLEFIDLAGTDDEAFPAHFPLGLDQLVTIPPKAIVVVAGTSNSGKTALCLNMLRDNIGGPDLLYCMSEMGPSEYRQRVKTFNDPLLKWQAVRAASISSGFDGAIQQHNPDGLNVVDFLEEIDGEYFRIASDIRSIYDALGDGIAVICIQKKSGALYGRGGESTSEKARLYLSLDNLFHRQGYSVCSIKIAKAKQYPGKNPNGLERHFKIVRGHEITPLCEWQYMDNAQRDKLVATYQRDTYIAA